MAQKTCFVVMGYGIRPDLTTGKRINLDRIYHEIIKPVVEFSGYKCIRGDEVLDSGLIDESMYYGILESDLVVADLTTLNPNAIYELGVRHGVRKRMTIIMMEAHDMFFFDLNHIRTIIYNHGKRKISPKEIETAKKRLAQIIQAIEKDNQTDSPLYKYVDGLSEPSLSESKNVVKRNGQLFERIREAVVLRKKKEFTKAKDLFKKLSEEVPSERFFRQQWALCTYKDQKPTNKAALLDAEKILEPITGTIDPETNGLQGAVYKRLYFETSEMAYLDKAIESYSKSFNLYDDYYTGENYAYCLNVKASVSSDEEEKTGLNAIAKLIRKKIYTTNCDIVEEEINTEYEIWMLATLATCAKALGKREEYKRFEELFQSKADSFMKDSHGKQQESLFKLLNI